MISKIISSSNLNWISAETLPECKGNKSVDVIMLYDDGFISRGYYNYSDHSWYGYNTFLNTEKYFNAPSYYIVL